MANYHGTGSERVVRWNILFFGVVALSGVLVFAVGVHDYLAISLPVDGNILLVEGWIWNSPSVDEAVAVFRRGAYKRMIVVGEPIGRGRDDHTETSSAEVIARRLQELGVEPDRIVVLTLRDVKRHHTFSSALALKDWLNHTTVQVTGINVFTIGAHARKSLVLFRRALGSQVPVGVIAGTEDSYDVHRWWLSPRGAYVVARKIVGYVYAVFWPFPDADRIHRDSLLAPNYSPVCARYIWRITNGDTPEV